MKNRLFDILGIEKPIIQGPFNWLTNAELVGAVSKAGGLGVLGFNAGQTSTAGTAEEAKERMRSEVRKVREITFKPIGLNIAPTADISKDPFTQPMLDLMTEENISIAVMAGELVPEWIPRFHEKKIKVVYRALTPTAENTRAAVAAGADVIVATGFDEGGTIPVKAVGTFSAIPTIVDAAEGKVPVMAAGGIADARTAKAAFALGADGLYVGTAFLLSQESPLADRIKEMAVKADADNLMLYRAGPAYYRFLPGELPDQLLKMSQNGVFEDDIDQAQKASIGMRDEMLFKELSKGYASFGLGISLIYSIKPVSDIIDELMSGLEPIR